MSDLQNDLPETVIDCLLQIEIVATSTDGTDADRRGRIVALAHRAASLIGEAPR